MYNICAVAEALLWSKNFPCCCFSLEFILSFKGRSSGPPQTFEALIQNDPLAVIASLVAEWDIIFGKQTGNSSRGDPCSWNAPFCGVPGVLGAVDVVAFVSPHFPTDF